MNIKRLLGIIILLSLLICSSVSPLHAVTANSTEIKVFVDGNALSLPLAPLVSEGSTLVPMRPIFSALDAELDYDAKMKTVTARKDKLTLIYTIGEKTAVRNGKVIQLPAAGIIKDKQTLVPLRLVGESLGATVGWLSAGRTVTVSSFKKTKTRVTRVIDGDTVDIKWGSGTERVRLVGVDTPETVHPRLGEEPYGREASNFTKKQLTGKDVFVEFDVEPRDKYDRLLAYVYFADGTFFNAKLVAEGYAQLLTYPPNVRWVDLFRHVQTDARNHNRGLWNPTVLTAENAFTPSTAPAVSNGKCATPTIKGNINSKGEKIFHVPGGDYYNVTKAEEMFCSEQDALDAGFRKSKR
jgi:micrococcal nuclease